MRHFVFGLLACLLFLAPGCWRDLDFDFDTPCSDVDCDDGNPCTTDSCMNFLDLFGTGVSGPTCVHEAGNTGSSCGSEGLTCRDGLCGDASLCEGVECEDDDPCTEDRCAWNGICQYDPVVCEDDDLCSEDRCDPNTGRCDSTTPAADGTFCWVNEQAFEVGGCEAGACIGPCDPESQEEQDCPVEFLFTLTCCPGGSNCMANCGS